MVLVSAKMILQDLGGNPNDILYFDSTTNHLKIDGWNTSFLIVSFWDGSCSGAMLVLGTVHGTKFQSVNK